MEERLLSPGGGEGVRGGKRREEEGEKVSERP